MRLRDRFVRLAPLCTVLAFAAAGCNACSEECRDPRQVGAGCQCSSDQDCTKPGQILLCEEGVCKEGDPADAPAKACNADDDCADGERCGFERCQPGPKCQRIDPSPLTGLRDDGTTGPVEITRASKGACAHELTFPAAALTFAADIAVSGAVTGDCTGTWSAALRAGAFACAPSVVVVADGTPCFVGGAACVANTTCRVIDDAVDANAGVCR